MAWRRPFNAGDLLHSGFFKPRKFFIGNKQLLITQEQPKAFVGVAGRAFSEYGWSHRKMISVLVFLGLSAVNP